VPATSCSKCGADLRKGSQICLECGEPVSAPESKVSPDASSGSDPKHKALEVARARRRSWVLWILVGLIVMAILWAATSGNPFAQGLQELAGSKQDQTIVDNPFVISAHNFRYYKFSVPEGEHVAVAGRFTVSGATSNPESNAQSDKNVEVYVLSEPAFAVWQTGYAANYVYESGRVSQGEVQADLPDEAGIYYLVFSNKFAPNAAKKVKADIVLRYKGWMPGSLRRAGERFWKWFGL